MKIDCRIEKEGNAILFFTDEVNQQNKMIACYAHVGQHSEACRAYMRNCKKPVTESELRLVDRLLSEWANQPR